QVVDRVLQGRGHRGVVLGRHEDEPVVGGDRLGRPPGVRVLVAADGRGDRLVEQRQLEVGQVQQFEHGVAGVGRPGPGLGEHPGGHLVDAARGTSTSQHDRDADHLDTSRSSSPSVSEPPSRYNDRCIACNDRCRIYNDRFTPCRPRTTLGSGGVMRSQVSIRGEGVDAEPSVDPAAGSDADGRSPHRADGPADPDPADSAGASGSARRGRTTRGGDKRRDLLDGSLAAFARDGYTRASIDTIARAAGTSTRTIYNHFGDKAGLFHAVIVDSARRVADAQIVTLDRYLGKIVDIEDDLIEFGRVWATPLPDYADHFTL